MRALLDQISHREDLLKEIAKADALPPAKYPEEQWRVAKALFRVLRRALVELQLVFAERGECDFTEVALQAKDALETEGGVVTWRWRWGWSFGICWWTRCRIRRRASMG